MLLAKIPSFTFPDVNGSQISIKDYAGKKTLILMWASW